MLTLVEAKIALTSISEYYGPGDCWQKRTYYNQINPGGGKLGPIPIAKTARRCITNLQAYPYPCFRSPLFLAPQTLVALSRNTWDEKEWHQAYRDLLTAVWGEIYTWSSSEDRKYLRHGFERLRCSSRQTARVMLQTYIQKLETGWLPTLSTAMEEDPYE